MTQASSEIESGETTVLYEANNAAVTLVLNRPSQMNALNRLLAKQLRESAQRAVDDDEARVIVIQGAGSNFMAGGDLREFQDSLMLDPSARDAAFGGLIDDAHSAIRILRSAGKPVVASVRGAVAGFGIGLLAACDLAICSDDAFFKLAYSQIGATPDGGATYALPRMAGEKRAMELTMLSDRIDPATAQSIGLVNKMVPAATLNDEISELVRRLANLPPGALAKTKILVQRGNTARLDDQLELERRTFIDCAGSPDFREGVTAFLDRRPPAFGVRQTG